MCDPGLTPLDSAQGRLRSGTFKANRYSPFMKISLSIVILSPVAKDFSQ